MLFLCHEKLRLDPRGTEAAIAAVARTRIRTAIMDQMPSLGTHKVHRDFE
jgi:hypothetical protein